MVSIGDKRSSGLITGCSPGGIGNALAQEFHQRGLRVFATARDTGALQSLVALRIETLSLVVDDERSVQSCYAEVRERLGEKGLEYLGPKLYRSCHGSRPRGGSCNLRNEFICGHQHVPNIPPATQESPGYYHTDWLCRRGHPLCVWISVQCLEGRVAFVQ